jgi:hypothetical protein
MHKKSREELKAWELKLSSSALRWVMLLSSLNHTICRVFAASNAVCASFVSMECSHISSWLHCLHAWSANWRIARPCEHFTKIPTNPEQMIVLSFLSCSPRRWILKSDSLRRTTWDWGIGGSMELNGSWVTTAAAEAAMRGRSWCVIYSFCYPERLHLFCEITVRFTSKRVEVNVPLLSYSKSFTAPSQPGASGLFHPSLTRTESRKLVITAKEEEEFERKIRTRWGQTSPTEYRSKATLARQQQQLRQQVACEQMREAEAKQQLTKRGIEAESAQTQQ